MKHVSIVAPVYNEERGIFLFVEELARVMDEHEYNYDLLLVDDGSRMKTRELYPALCEQYSCCSVLLLSRNFGHQAAITAGIDFADGDAVIIMDADLQHPPKFLPTLISHWDEGFDLVTTIRKKYETKEGIFKGLSSRIFYFILNKLSEVEIPSGGADFRLMDKKVVIAMRGLREKARFMRGLTNWVGFKKIEVEYVAESRIYGETKFNLRKMMRLANDGLISMSTVPLSLALIMGVFISLLSGVYMLYVVWAFFFTERAIAGWSSLVFINLFLGGTILMMTGISGLYIAKIYKEVKGRPIYIVDEIIGENPQRS